MCCEVRNVKGISIHALLAESDPPHTCPQFWTFYFYPRSPCGERPPQPMRQQKRQTFLSTLSLRRATTSQVPTWFGMPNFYPRSPCGERRSAALLQGECRDFYPRSPCGERLRTRHGNVKLFPISIHALLAESDLTC